MPARRRPLGAPGALIGPGRLAPGLWPLPGRPARRIRPAGSQRCGHFSPGAPAHSAHSSTRRTATRRHRPGSLAVRFIDYRRAHLGAWRPSARKSGARIKPAPPLPPSCVGATRQMVARTVRRPGRRLTGRSDAGAPLRVIVIGGANLGAHVYRAQIHIRIRIHIQMRAEPTARR